MKKNILLFPILFVLLSFSRFSVYSQDYVSSLKDSLENLINRSEHDILILHFSSLLQVINSESLTIPDSNRIEDLYNAFYVDDTQINLTELETYINGNKPLIVSWISPTDGQVSFTWLTLPDNWDPENEYPLYVDLHGRENIAEKKIRYMAVPYYERGDFAIEVAFEDGYHIEPWGRGNQWYMGIAETDIYESVAKIEELFKINSKRKYLGGYSMGGYGAMYIASRSNDIWAGVGLHSTGFPYDLSVMSPPNIFALRELPVYVFCGVLDNLYQFSVIIYNALLETGNNNVQLVEFQDGHTIRQEDVEGYYNWIRNFEKQPDIILNYPDSQIPGDTVKVFAPDIISKEGRNEYAARINTNGSEFYFSVEQDNRSILTTYCMQYEDSVWSEEDTAFFSKEVNNSGEPWIVNDSIIYFTKNTENMGEVKSDFWKVEKNESGEWEDPVAMDATVNAPDQQNYISMSNNNNIFFSSDGEAYMFTYLGNNLYSEPAIIEHPARTDDLIEDIFIDPDENYIIYAAVTPESQGNKDLYIVYNNYGLYCADFTYPKKLNPPVNSDYDEFAPFVSPDKKYLFFSRKKDNETDIFWVKADLIDSLRNTNFIPYKMDSLPDLNATVDRYFSYTLPDNVFIDDNGMSSLFIQVKQSNGDNLPEGLSYDRNNFVIHGTPAIAGEFTILISVEDQEGYTLSDEFLLTIDEPSGIVETRSVLLNVYPNPAKNSIFIDHEIISTSTGFALINTKGMIVKKGYLNSNSIDVSELTNGLYFIRIISGEKLFIAKFFKE